MYEYISGKLTEINPAFVVVETNGVGYFINISLHTYSKLTINQDYKVYIHQVIREDAHSLFGFADKSEREIFRHLISVSGIGPNTGRMILSSMSPNDVRQAILSENVNLLKTIKGIGIKTAQRVILELKDKLSKTEPAHEILFVQNNTIREESLSALIMLGFSKKDIEKSIDKILISEKNITVEELVKKALKSL